MGLLEAGMYPAKKGLLKAEEEGEGKALEVMKWFDDLDGWLERETGGTVEALLMGCVGGVVEV